MSGSVSDRDFDEEQKRYLEGFASGLRASRLAREAKRPASSAEIAMGGSAERMGPDVAHWNAQDRFLSQGKKLSEQERVKREAHPFDCYERLKEQAERNEAPKPADNFRWRYFGLFYVAPAQRSYMCRLRIPNGILAHWQLRALAGLAERYGGGYAHVTTRANLQIREIEPRHAVAMVEAIQDIGLSSRGAGADNIRNVTGSPTAGIDPQELIDTRPYAREWHYHILNDRSLYGLPRKLNVAFDGGGAVPVLEETNDIGFQAAVVKEGFGVDAGVWFRLALGGVTGHKQLAFDTGVVVEPRRATKVADAIVRVFIDHGDRTNRERARLKYVIDALGVESVLRLAEEKLGRPLARVPAGAIAPRPPFGRTAHIGVHKQKQPGLNWIGVVLPVGRMSAEQMRGLAQIAETMGDGDVRLTVWQNLLISGIPDARTADAEAAVEGLGLSTRAASLRAGLVACTGNVGCKFAASDTKRHAEEIARWCESRIALDTPVNVHLTGCKNSCAQHYIGDIGLLGCKVRVGGDGDAVEGYHLFVGGGFGPGARLGREVFRDIKADDVPPMVERMLKAYLAHRQSPQETFSEFTARHDIEALKALFAEAGTE